MILATIVLSAAMAGQPTTAFGPSKTALRAPAHTASIELHSMTEEEKHVFPGRERFDKTEWYESCFKSARAIIAPEHVDEWKNGGVDAT